MWVVGYFEVFLFRRQRTIREITRSVTKHEASSCGFVTSDTNLNFEIYTPG